MAKGIIEREHCVNQEESFVTGDTLLGSPLKPGINLTYHHSFTKADSNHVAAQACVFSLPNGMWSTGWREVGNDGVITEEIWFEGQMDEMIASFRSGVAAKFHLGFNVMLA